MALIIVTGRCVRPRTHCLAMNLPKPLPFLAAALLYCATPMATAPVHASSAILRCQSPDGSSVYTDKACSTLGASAAPLDGDLLNRIARDQAHEQALLGDAYANATTAWNLDSGSQWQARAQRKRNPANGCARTPTQLAMDLGASIASGDVNRIAESYHWAGKSARTGERIMDRLQYLTGKQVLDSQYFNARIGWSDTADATGGAGTWTADASSTGRGGNAGMLQVVLAKDGSRSAVDFDVHRYAGCYFVSY